MGGILIDKGNFVNDDIIYIVKTTEYYTYIFFNIYIIYNYYYNIIIYTGHEKLKDRELRDFCRIDHARCV